MLNQFLHEVQSEDLVILGMQASAVKAGMNPFKIVSYTLEASSTPRMVLQAGSDLVEVVSGWNPKSGSVAPVCGPGMTATDYLRLIAVCRLLHPALHIEVDLAVTGLKIGQLALGFGADDLGSIKSKPSSQFDEEDIRRIIREAGLEPKRRDTTYTYYWLD